MKKLALKLEALAVESFHTGEADEAFGTVHGREAPTYPNIGCPIRTKPTDCPCTPVAAFEAATRPYACDPFSLPPRCS